MIQRYSPVPLWKQELQLKETLEILDLANVLAWDVNDRITLWNRGAEVFYGWTKQEALGAVPHELLQTTFPAPLSSIREALFQKGSWEGELGHVRKDGTRVSVASNWILKRNNSGEPTTILEINKDLTAQKRAEKRLDLITDTASRLLRSDSPQTVVDSLCWKVLDFLDCQAFFNYLASDLHKCLLLNAYAGISAEEADKIKYLDYGIAVCGCAALESNRIVCEDIQNTPDLRTDLVRAYGIQAYACHPLMSGEKVLGTLSFGTRTRTTFTEDELSLMKTVADLVAIAIERTHAQENLRLANEVLERRVVERTTELQAEALERQKSQDALREQSRFLESFFRYSLNPLVFLDRNFNFIRVNRAYAQACSREAADFVGRNHFDFFPHVENRAIFEEVVRTKKPYVAAAKPFSYPDMPERGVTYWDWTLVPVLDAVGEVDFLFFGLKDVTRAKRAEDELRAAYRYSRNLLEASLDPLVTINTDGKITDVNKATELATGVPRTELIGSNFSDYFTEPQKANEGYQQVFHDGLVRDYLLTIRHLSGAKMDVLYNAAVYRNDAGEIQGVFAAARDITELKAAERRRDFTNALLELFAQKTSLKEYLGSVLEIIHKWAGCEAIGIRILDGGDHIPYYASSGFPPNFVEAESNLSISTDSCICTRAISQTYQSQEMAAITACGSFCCSNGMELVRGLPPEQQARYRGQCLLSGYKSITVIPISHLDRVLGAIHMADSREAFFGTATVEFLESISPLIGEAVNRFHAEEELNKYRDHLEELVRQRTAEMESANRQLQTEIAERKLAEESLGNTAEELARSNRDLEQFAYVASHDLQEPLRAVSGYIQLLRQRYVEKLDDKALQYVAGAVDGAERMQRLITDLLAFSRVGTRGRDLEWTELSAIFGTALENLSASITESGAAIACDPLPKLHVDPTQFVQLFQNLLGNAIKFRSTRPPQIYVTAKKQPGEWLFSVKDNGIGIESQYAERIFMIFQRLHTRRNYPGTGMGLAICKKIVERYRGKIWVESQPGEGSAFYFTIPD